MFNKNIEPKIGIEIEDPRTISRHQKLIKN